MGKWRGEGGCRYIAARQKGEDRTKQERWNRSNRGERISGLGIG